MITTADPQSEDINSYEATSETVKGSDLIGGYRTEDGILLDEAHFPDKIFRDYLYNTYDQNKNHVLSHSEIMRIWTLNLGGTNVASLEGVKYLTEVDSIYAYHTKLTNVDLTGLPNLLTLDLSECALNSLNIRANKNLRTLYLSDTTGSLKTVDTSQNAYLSELEVYRGSIRTIDVRSNPELKDAALYGMLDATSGSASYQAIYRSDTGAYLSLTKNNEQAVIVADLKSGSADFPSDQFRREIVTECDWNSDGWLSVTEAKSVTALSPEDDEEAVTTLTGVELFPNLTSLSAYNCRIGELVFTKNPKLQFVDVSYNRVLKKLDVSALPALKSLYCYGNALKDLIIRDQKALEEIDAEDNALETLNIYNCPKLFYVNAADNKLTSPYLSGRSGAYRRSFAKQQSVEHLSFSARERRAASASQQPELPVQERQSAFLDAEPSKVLLLQNEADLDRYPQQPVPAVRVWRDAGGKDRFDLRYRLL